MEIAAVKMAQTPCKSFYVFLNAGEHLTEKFNDPKIESPTLAGQRHVGPDAQALGDALPAILSAKSALSVVKNRIKFLPQMAQRTQMKQISQTESFSEEERSTCSRFCPMRDRKTQPRSWRCSVRADHLPAMSRSAKFFARIPRV
jgi:hypothetical protein